MQEAFRTCQPTNLRPRQLLTITEQKRVTLERWARRPKTAPALTQRSKIILACAKGASNTDVAITDEQAEIVITITLESALRDAILSIGHGRRCGKR